MSDLNIFPELTREQTGDDTINALNRITDGSESLEDLEKAYSIIKNASDISLREKYASISYSFAKYTIAFWMFLFFVYFLSPINAKPISETALGIFTTACTINILAAFISIIKGLFPAK